MVSAPAAGQSGYEVQQLHPSPDQAGDFFSVRSARTLNARAWTAGLIFNFASRPLVLSDPDLLDPPYRPVRGRVVTSQTVMHLVGAYGLVDWLDVGVDLPVYVQQNGDVLTGLDSPQAVTSSFGLGDVRLSPRLQLLDTVETLGLSFAFALDLGLPTGNRDRFQGSGFRLEPSLVAEWKTPFGVRIAGHAGYAWRASDIDVLELGIGDTWAWGVGLDVPVFKDLGPFQRLNAVAEVYGDISKELVVGAKLAISDFHVVAAFGAGLPGDSTSADWRSFLGLGYSSDAPRPQRLADLDQDGIPDEVDRCPTEAEDIDGFEDSDGCPDIDNDKDGIADHLDRCPFQKEDLDGFEDTDGCDDPDNDKDGVTDANDLCLNEPEDRDNFQDGDGCPDPDNDQDQIADLIDRCPLDPEDFDGHEDTDGCPDFDLSMSIDVVVYFDPDAATISPEDSYQLDRVARTLQALPSEMHVFVEGHADDTATRAHNEALSMRRANAVKSYLVARGVATKRLSVQGYGVDRHIRTNETAKEKQLNRRVEFRVAPRSQKTTKAQAPAAPQRSE